ncbi:MAG TPA: hypothetical protein VGF98_00275 [Candidatus Tumulicola sp.]
MLLRLIWAALLAGAGIAILVRRSLGWWGAGATCFFRTPEGLTPDQVARLERTLAARRAAEGSAVPWRRSVGILAILLAIVELIPAVPFAIPYALFCLGLAASELICFSGMRRAVHRRAAALVPRSPLQAIPPFLYLTVGAAFTGVVLASPGMHPLVVIVIAVATAILAWIAWQIAAGRALLLGDDPKMEYAVDERLRVLRVTNMATLACAPATALVASSIPFVADSYRRSSDVASWIAEAALLAAVLGAFVIARRSAVKFERDIA